MIEAAFHDERSAPRRTRGAVRVWDPMVRLFHWGLVLAFAAAWLSAEDLQALHELAGYTVAGLVAFRVVWGFAGGRYARFVQFLRGPAATLSYLGDTLRGREHRYIGHNPAGGVMVIALLVTLSGTAFTGWLMAEPQRIAMLPALPQVITPAQADEGGSDNDWDEMEGRGEAEGPVKDLHEALANLMLLLVALHVGGVALASFRHRENLVRAMVTGRKRAPEPGDIV